MKIGKTMPENLFSITADELCKMVGVKNLHLKDNKDINAPIIPEQTKKEKRKGCWEAILWLLALVVLLFVLLELGAFDYLLE